MEPKKDRLEWVFFVGIIFILFLPLLNFPPLFSPPDFGKAIIFRIIVSILLFLFIAKNLLSKSQGRALLNFVPQNFGGRGHIPKKGLSEATEQGPSTQALSARSAAESGAASRRWSGRLRTFLGTSRAPLVSLTALFFVFLLERRLSQI